MAWNETFPQPSDIISLSPPQFQDNWTYIQNTMQVDHFFADANPSNDGHHNVIQMPSQAMDPVLSSPMRVEIYGADSNGQDVLRFRNSGAIMASIVYHIPYGERGTVAIAGGGAGTVNLIDFTGKPPIAAQFQMYDVSGLSPNLGIFATFTWDGFNINVQTSYSGNSTVAANSTSWINVLGSTTFLQLNKNHANPRAGRWQYFGTPYQT